MQDQRSGEQLRGRPKDGAALEDGQEDDQKDGATQEVDQM